MSLVNDLALYKDGATGDMYYRNASGLLVPVTGTQTTGYVPTKQADGSVAWAAAGGGGGSLTVKDEGTNLSTAVTSINFVGAKITATGTTAVTVTVAEPAVKFWRVYVTLANGTNIRIGELAMRATSGGTNLCTGGTILFSSQASGSGDNSAAAAFDGNTATAWASSGGQPAWLGYQFATATTINEIVITGRNDSFVSDSPRDFSIQSSVAGNGWVDEWGVTGSTGWTAGLVRTFTRP